MVGAVQQDSAVIARWHPVRLWWKVRNAWKRATWGARGAWEWWRRQRDAETLQLVFADGTRSRRKRAILSGREFHAQWSIRRRCDLIGIAFRAPRMFAGEHFKPMSPNRLNRGDQQLLKYYVEFKWVSSDSLSIDELV